MGSYFSSFIKGKRKASYTQSLAHTSFRPENDNREGPRRVLSSFDYARGKVRVCHNNCWQLLSCLVVSEPLGSGGLSELHADIHFCRSTIHDCIQCSAGGLGNAFATKSGEDDFRRFRAGSALDVRVHLGRGVLHPMLDAAIYGDMGRTRRHARPILRGL